MTVKRRIEGFLMEVCGDECKDGDECKSYPDHLDRDLPHMYWHREPDGYITGAHTHDASGKRVPGPLRKTFPVGGRETAR